MTQLVTVGDTINWVKNATVENIYSLQIDTGY